MASGVAYKLYYKYTLVMHDPVKHTNFIRLEQKTMYAWIRIDRVEIIQRVAKN